MTKIILTADKNQSTGQKRQKKIIKNFKRKIRGPSKILTASQFVYFKNLMKEHVLPINSIYHINIYNEVYLHIYYVIR